MSAARDLAIARGAWKRGWFHSHTTETALRAVIAAVDASLGGEAGKTSRLSSGAEHTEPAGYDEAANCGDAASDPGPAEPPSDLLAALQLSYRKRYAGILAPHLVEESAQWLARFLEPYLQEAAAIGRREAKREAVGLIRDLLDYIVTEPDHPVPRDILRARAYIAAAEADAAEGKP